MNFPDSGLGCQDFNPNFSLPASPALTDPHHTKFRLILFILDVEDRAGPNRAYHTVQHCSAIADVPDLGMLRERHRFRVHAPDAHGQICRDTPISTTIHIAPSEQTHVIVWHGGRWENLPGLPNEGV